MDCFDEILEIYHEKDRKEKCLTFLIKLINNKAEKLTELQLKNCIIITLAIWNDNFIDEYLSKGQDLKELDVDKKKALINILQSECEDPSN